MSHPPRPTDTSQPLAAWVRQRLVSLASVALESLLALVQAHLNALMDEAVASRELQARRDIWMAFQGAQGVWLRATVQAWQDRLHAQVAPKTAAREALTLNQLSLVDESVVENKILASRLALGLMEEAAQEVNDLRRRVRALQDDRELASDDVLHPEVLLLPLVEQWQAAGLSVEGWTRVVGVVQRHLNMQLRKAYAQCNADLIERGVLPVLGYSARPTPEPQAAASAEAGAAGAAPAPRATPRARWGGAAVADAGPNLRPGGPVSPASASAPQASADAGAAGWAGVPHWAQGHANAQRVMAAAGEVLAGVFQPGAGAVPASPELLQALQAPAPLPASAQALSWSAGAAVPPELVQQVAHALDEQTAQIKRQAQTSNEKAVIELVALMFQAILQEDRIPSGVRLWFARLQMPVLRLALTDPGFFNREDHPARRLIDHMGSCVMGFDGSDVNAQALQAEVRRIVEVIEQYPETGERVFVRVYEEFQAFLKRFLTAESTTHKVVSVIEQFEQKETLSVQYTIELRNQLQDLPVRDEVKDFLFKRWAEVLALVSVRHGALSNETTRYKNTAADLIWATSAKPDRAERARLIAQLPDLLARLRAGMGLLGLSEAEQSAQIKVLNQVLTDAFTARNAPIDRARIDALAESLAQLEDLVADGSQADLAIDAPAFAELLGADASALDVLPPGGDASPGAVMIEWASDLTLGAWFKLQTGPEPRALQYAWRSPLGHLHLFTTRDGRGCLIQTLRLAQCLKSGQLEPVEEDALSVRATQSAVQAVQADPARLLR